MPEPVVKSLLDEGLSLASAIITLRDMDVLKALRALKANTLPKTFWQNLVKYLIEPEAVLLDTTQDKPALLYIIDMGDGKGKAIVRVDEDNVISSAKPFKSDAKTTQYKVLYGEIKE